MIEIKREHIEYRQQKWMRHMYRDLYRGGHEFKLRAGEYLTRRQKEPLDVYSERLHRVFYQNYIGSIIDWYGVTLFRRAASLEMEGGLQSGRDFLAAFADDCDVRGTGLSEFFRKLFVDALVDGRSHILVDFPRGSAKPANRAEEDAAGLSRAYLVPYRTEELINWCKDERGEYQWVVLRQTAERQISVGSEAVVEETTWFYFDQQQFRTYKTSHDKGHEGDPVLVASGQHCLAEQNRVPLFTLEAGEGMWLMNKAAHLQLEHFNKSNALGWAITMGLFAMPVVYSDREWSQIVGESYYVQLGPQDRFGWTEPEGKVYQVAGANLETLKEEIYRVCYLAQASGEQVGGHAQSAASKQMDFTITSEVLRGFAATVKGCIRRVLTAVTEARKDGVAINVSGLDEVDISDLNTELDTAAKLLQFGIPSPTLRRQMFQRLAMKYLSDARQETKEQVAREIAAQLAE